MSTKALRELVKMAVHGERMRVLSYVETGAKAARELSTVSHAAKVITNPVAHSTDDWLKAWELMKTLAKEAT